MLSFDCVESFQPRKFNKMPVTKNIFIIADNCSVEKMNAKNSIHHSGLLALGGGRPSLSTLYQNFGKQELQI